MDGILFANGVALAPDGSHIVLAETGKCCLHRYWLNGPEAGKSDILCVLPGYPDNISAGSDGLVWVAIPTERNNALNCHPQDAAAVAQACRPSAKAASAQTGRCCPDHGARC